MRSGTSSASRGISGAVSGARGTRVTENHFHGTRAVVKRQTSDRALTLALDYLTEVQA